MSALKEENSTLPSWNERLDVEESALRNQRELAQVCVCVRVTSFSRSERELGWFGERFPTGLVLKSVDADVG